MRVETNDVSRKKWISLFVVVLMSFMSCIDSSIVNVTLPLMAKKLSVSMASIEWVIASYVLVICSTLLLFGRLGDIIGKTNIFKIGIVLFTIGSLLCGFSSSLPMLIMFRVVQGVGAGAYMANNQGIITELFPQKGRGKALGILASAVSLGVMIGPPAGGLIASYLGWNYIFLVNVPIGIISFIASLKVLKDGSRKNEELDTKGTALFFIITMFLFGSLIEGQQVGYNNPIIIIGFVLAIIGIPIFIALERKIEYPLLQLKIFENDVFSLSLFCAFISFTCIAASMIIIPFYLEDTLKISSANSGMFMMIQPIIVTIISPLMGTLSDRIGSELLTLAGLIFIAVGFLTMSFLNQHSSIGYMVICVSLMALGQGLFQPPNNSLIMSAVSKNKLGIAGSVNSLVRNLGQIVGITLSTTLLYSFMSIKIGHKVIDYVFGRDEVFVYAMKHVYIILMFICILGISLTMFRLYRTKTKSTFN